MPDDLAPAGAEDLSQADFPGPARGSRGGQVHEIDAGDGGDEHGNGGEEIDVGDIAVRREFPFEMGMEMDVHQGLQAERQRFLFAAVSVAEVFLHEGGQLRLERGRIGAFPKQEVAVGPAPAELVDRYLRIGLLDAERREYVESQVRIRGQIPHDAGDLELKRALGVENLPDGIPVAEVLSRDGFRQHHFFIVPQRRSGIAPYQGHIEYVENRSVGQIEGAFVEPLVAVLDHPSVSGRHETDHVFHFRKVGLDELGRRDQHVGIADDLIPLALLRDHAVDAVRLVVEPVVAQFVADVDQNEEAARDPERQARYVDERIALLAVQMADGHGEITAEHQDLESASGD